MTTTDTITTVETEVDPERAGYIAGLRQLADLLEQHDELPLPYHGSASPMTMHFLAGEDPRAALAAALRVLPGRWNKGHDVDPYFDVTGRLHGLTLTLTAFRDAVCTRVVTGVETVTVQVPDPEALAAVPTVEVTREVEQIEWRCHPLLADEAHA